MEDGSSSSQCEVPAVVEDRYELQEQIGRGSTGTVWEARDRVSSRLVAVKVLDAGLLTSPAARRRFAREAEAASTLRHGHLVEILGHGYAADGRGYLVMERLIGTTLAHRLRDGGPLLQARAIKIVSEILQAVGAAHQVQIVHRDLKAGNVMLVDRDGDPDFVKVYDFGLAKAIQPDDADGDVPAALLTGHSSITTGHGDICGTPEYMAPEQARGEIVDARADLYAVGVILYCALVGHVPFRALSRLEILSMHLSAAPPRPSAVRPDLKIFPPLENLILRALAKDRADRPCSADVFRAELLQIGRDHERRLKRSRGHAEGTADAATLAGEPRAPKTNVGRGVALALALVLVATVVSFAAQRGMSAAQRGAPPADAVPAGGPRAERAAAAAPIVPLEAARRPAVRAPAPPRARASARPSRKPPPPPTPRADEELLRLAGAQLQSGRVAESCGTAERALLEAPERADIWEFLGRCYMRAGEPERGRGCYRRSLALAPSAPNAPFIKLILEEPAP
ncbi:MAG TPA: protein kinase [Polyangia bacterium]